MAVLYTSAAKENILPKCLNMNETSGHSGQSSDQGIEIIIGYV
jgi:hypothetical protein